MIEQIKANPAETLEKLTQTENCYLVDGSTNDTLYIFLNGENDECVAVTRKENELSIFHQSENDEKSESILVPICDKLTSWINYYR